MHRTRLCVVCMALASLVALLLLLSPSVATADGDLPTTVKIGEAEAANVVVATLTMLGTDKPAPGFKLLVLYKNEDGSNHNITCVTDGDGKLRIELFEMPKELRVFAYGDYVIPEGWSNIPISTMKFDGEEPVGPAGTPAQACAGYRQDHRQRPGQDRAPGKRRLRCIGCRAGRHLPPV